MIAFISYIIKLFIKMLFVKRLAQEHSELKKKVQLIEEEKEEFKHKNQRLKQEKEELVQDKQQLLQRNCSIAQKYVVIPIH